MPQFGKPRKLVVGTKDSSLRSRIEEIASKHGLETVFSSSQDEIVSLALANLPSIALLDLASKAYDPYRCCARLEANPNVVVYVYVPDSEWESILRGTHEVYGWGYTIASRASELLEDLELVIEGRHDEIDRKRRARQ